MNDLTYQYQSLAKEIIAYLPSGWKKAWIKSEIQDDMSESTYDYEDSDGKDQWFDPDAGNAAAVGRTLRGIRKSMATPGQESWSRCTFTLFPDGTFKFDVEYDD
jgi:hypothetical protein